MSNPILSIQPKKKIGTSTEWQFEMKCTSCQIQRKVINKEALAISRRLGEIFIKYVDNFSSIQALFIST